MSLLTEQWQGHALHFSSTDAFVNITEMCAIFGKRPNDFLALPATKRYLDALAQDTNQLPENLVIARRGQHASGTWAHPDLALECARWLSPQFSIWCNRIIRRLLSGDLIHDASDKALLAQLRADLELLKSQLGRQHRRIAQAETVPGTLSVRAWAQENGVDLTPRERSHVGRRLAIYAFHGHIPRGWVMERGTAPSQEKQRTGARKTSTYLPALIAQEVDCLRTGRPAPSLKHWQATPSTS